MTENIEPDQNQVPIDSVSLEPVAQVNALVPDTNKPSEETSLGNTILESTGSTNDSDDSVEPSSLLDMSTIPLSDSISTFLGPDEPQELDPFLAEGWQDTMTPWTILSERLKRQIAPYPLC